MQGKCGLRMVHCFFSPREEALYCIGRGEKLIDPSLAQWEVEESFATRHVNSALLDQNNIHVYTIGTTLDFLALGVGNDGRQFAPVLNQQDSDKSWPIKKRKARLPVILKKLSRSTLPGQEKGLQHGEAEETRELDL